MKYDPQLSYRQIEHFWYGVEIKEDNNACWEWKRGLATTKDIGQYGVIWFDGKKHKAHRIAWVVSRGPIEGEMFVCHKCDNPKCCNPQHLFLGTPKDNVADCLNKGRAHKESGSRRYNAKLTEEVIAILKAEAPYRKYGWGVAMAKKYGVAPTAINNVIAGRRWRQIGDPNPIPAISSPHVH